MPWHTLIPPRAGHPIGGHAWVPIDDETLLGLVASTTTRAAR